MKHFASCSFGKDSIATILLALQHNEPLDGAVFAEVMFDNTRGISGEIPEHIEWVKNIAIPKLQALGCPTHIVRNTKDDYMTQFHHITQKSKDPSRIGKKQGFLIGGRCILNNRGKIKPLKQFFKQFNEQVIEYVGIAIDEPKRLEKLHKQQNKVSLLEKYNYTEQMAYDLCKQYDLLSPLYKNAQRGGCWFCPNAKICEFAKLKVNHPELWNELEQLAKEPDYIGGFRYGESFNAINEKVDKVISSYEME